MQALQVNNQTVLAPVKAIGVDVGYGFVKVVSPAARVSFPAVVAPYIENPLAGVFHDGTGHKVRLQKASGEVEDKLVGEAALRSLAVTATLSREKPAAFHDLMLLAAAYLAGAGDRGPFPKQVDLAVGLPLAYFRAQKDALKKRLEGMAAWVSVDGGEERYISFGKVMVFPQGAGVVLAGELALPGKGYLGVVDAGIYTTDYLLFEDRGDGVPRPLPEACGSLEVGVHLVHRALAAEFQRQTGAPLAPVMYQDVVESALAGRPIHYAAFPIIDILAGKGGGKVASSIETPGNSHPSRPPCFLISSPVKRTGSTGVVGDRDAPGGYRREAGPAGRKGGCGPRP
ncbi:ParM/StbA family protein [Moorella sulfitireducens (nom. illeg.)]|uniref:ParM/StbA family protein n=1 Tax=Neomoorella sulfitireducens TaxID=2972948 RepID=UPI0021AC09D9|nr:ParM/StbA family protein [Moorella sulfitireducens]